MPSITLAVEDAYAAEVPTPTSVNLPSHDAQSADVLWQGSEVDFPLNRAERRAQQRQDAHAMRNQRKRRR
jgi:hypothetical protein